jgi:hypothetical protein
MSLDVETSTKRSLPTSTVRTISREATTPRVAGAEPGMGFAAGASAETTGSGTGLLTGVDVGWVVGGRTVIE